MQHLSRCHLQHEMDFTDYIKTWSQSSNLIIHRLIYVVQTHSTTIHTCINVHSPIFSLSLQTDLAQLYIKAGLKNMGTVFLLTDAQVPDEKFLVLINDLLASGEIPDLFAGKLDQKKSFSEPLNTPPPPPLA